MTLKLAKQTKTAKQKTITLEEMEKELAKNNGQKIFYFDYDNPHKDMNTVVEHFEDEGYSVYFKEVRFGLDENDYLYEVHIL